MGLAIVCDRITSLRAHFLSISADNYFRFLFRRHVMRHPAAGDRHLRRDLEKIEVGSLSRSL